MSDDVASIIVDVSSKREDEGSDFEEVVKMGVEVPPKKDDEVPGREKSLVVEVGSITAPDEVGPSAGA